MTPSEINDAARAMMATVAEMHQDRDSTMDEIADLKLRIEELEKIIIAMASGSGQSISLHNGRPVLLGIIGGDEQIWRTGASARSLP